MTYTVYVLRCSDDSLYTGYTNDIERRVHEHRNTKKGSKYVRSRRPFELVYQEDKETQSEAMSREAEIKNMTKSQKEELVNAD